MNAKLSSLRKTVSFDSSDEDILGMDRALRVHEQTQFVLATTRGDLDMRYVDRNRHMYSRYSYIILLYMYMYTYIHVYLL